jgi:hypothetical protein
MRSLGSGDVLWIEPGVCYMAAMPEGFAFRVRALLGLGGPDARGVLQVWVSGCLLDGHGRESEVLELLVPVDCQKAVPVRRDVGPSRVAEGGRHRSDRHDPGRAMTGPPPGYVRRYG